MPVTNIRTLIILPNIRKLFLFFFFFSFWTPVHSQTIPDLSRLGYETRSSIMLICAIVKSLGPAVYVKCIRNRFNRRVVALPFLICPGWTTRPFLQ